MKLCRTFAWHSISGTSTGSAAVSQLLFDALRHPAAVLYSGGDCGVYGEHALERRAFEPLLSVAHAVGDCVFHDEEVCVGDAEGCEGLGCLEEER